MNHLERQIRSARRRLDLNRWIEILSALGTITILIFAVLTLIERLYGLHWPLATIAATLVLAALLTSFALLQARRISIEAAAAALDDRANLRERLSSAWHCRDTEDPFAAAVIADAERASTGLHSAQFIRIHVPRRWGLPILAAIASASVFLISPGVLKSNETKKQEAGAAEREETRAVVKKHIEEVKKSAESIPGAEDLKADLASLEATPNAQLENPGEIRREAIKKLDRLEDEMRAKRNTDQFDAVPQLQRMLRGLKAPESADAATQKLTQALQAGDFKAAKEEVQALKDQLASLKSDTDKEFAEKAQKQLDELGKQLEKLAENQDLKKQLEQAGIKKEDVERMLERLSKQDVDQLKRQLEENGVNSSQIERLAKQLQQKQQAGEMANQLAKALKQAGQGKAGQSNSSSAALSGAAQQLGDLEKLEQEMNQLDSAMASVQNAKDSLDKQCPS
ncbi:MAG: hypothetical protein HY287_05455 [Planctomycetes bacterium]|nr:hypothetical protein [Planctomycetota bacterium]MBI3833757.1 hypothetical protein [Planctomycetota bacterium]